MSEIKRHIRFKEPDFFEILRLFMTKENQQQAYYLLYKWKMTRLHIKIELWSIICSNQSRKPNSNPCSNQLQTARTGLIEQLSQFLPPLPPLDQLEKAKYIPQTNYMGCPSPSQLAYSFPRLTASHQGISEVFLVFFSTIKVFPLFCLPLSLCQMHVMVTDCLAIASSE